MKFCVYGAGAIGGYLAVELALSGQEVCVVARGPHLEAIREHGLKLVIHGREKIAKIAASEDPRDFRRAGRGRYARSRRIRPTTAHPHSHRCSAPPPRCSPR